MPYVVKKPIPKCSSGTARCGTNPWSQTRFFCSKGSKEKCASFRKKTKAAEALIPTGGDPELCQVGGKDMVACDGSDKGKDAPIEGDPSDVNPPKCGEGSVCGLHTDVSFGSNYFCKRAKGVSSCASGTVAIIGGFCRGDECDRIDVGQKKGNGFIGYDYDFKDKYNDNYNYHLVNNGYDYYGYNYQFVVVMLTLFVFSIIASLLTCLCCGCGGVVGYFVATKQKNAYTRKEDVENI